MSGKNILIYVIVFSIVIIPYLVLQIVFSSKPRMNTSSEGRNLPPVFRLIWKLLIYMSEPMNSVIRHFPPELKTKAENWLIIADIRMDLKQLAAASIFLSMSFVCAAMLLFLCFTTNGAILIPVALIAAILGLAYPFTTIQDLAQKRQRKIMRALPFALDLLCSSIRSGIDFNASVSYLVNSDKERGPLTVEFGKMLQSIQYGRTRVEAIEEMAARIQMEEFTAFAEAVSHSSEAGSSIVDTLKVQAKEMRRARFNIAERKAARAASAMIFPIALFIMPAMILIIAAPIVMQVISSGGGGIFK